MDYPKFIVSNKKEESISIQRVKWTTIFTLEIFRHPLPKLNAALHKSCAKAGFSAALLKKLRKSCIFQTWVKAVEMLPFFFRPAYKLRKSCTFLCALRRSCVFKLFFFVFFFVLFSCYCFILPVHWCVGGRGGPSPSHTLQTTIFFINKINV